MVLEHPFRDVVIAGIANSRQARMLPGETSASITLEAVRGALADAGITPADVDGVSVRSGALYSQEMLIPQRWVHAFGGRACWTGSPETGIRAVLEAAAAIATGQCETVVVACGQAGTYADRAATAPWTRPANEFVECFGLYTAAEFALVARRHMHLYGTTVEQMAEVAATIRNHGSLTLGAVHEGAGPFTAPTIMASRLIADPFHLLDCSMTSEGGAALVLTTTAHARDLPCTPVHLLGGALDRRGEAYVAAPVWDEVGDVGKPAARRAFGMAGCTPADVDVCELYDPFSFEVIRQFEAFGFCAEGEGGPFVMGGRVALGGQYPICTDGGTMAFSHPMAAQQLQKVIAAAKQIRGEAGKTQVPGARIALASNGGAGALYNDVILLGQSPP